MVPFRANAPEAELDPETEVLLGCTGIAPDPMRGDRVRCLLQRGLDWDRLVGLGQAHGLLPFLYRNLHATCSGAVPGTVMDQFRARFHGLAWRNLILTKELAELLDLFRDRGVPAIPFKGPVLAVQAYGDVSLRPFNDFDILVDEHDVLTAKDALKAAGYRLDPALSDAEAAALLRADREHHFTLYRDGGQPVELHWRVIQRCFAFPFDPKCWWGRLVPVTVGPATVTSFGAEDLLLLLCAHGAKHAWSRLLWIADLDALIRSHPHLDWDLLLGQADALNSRRLLGVGLRLAHDLLGTPLPEEVPGRLARDPVIGRLARGATSIVLSRSEGPAAGEFMEDKAFFIRARERLRDRIEVCLGLEKIPAGVDRSALPWPVRVYIGLVLALRPNERDREVLRLPRGLGMGYYLIRPIRLLGKYVGGIGKRLFHSFIRKQRTVEDDFPS